MRNINYFDKELSVEEYVKKEVCKNVGTQSVAFKEQHYFYAALRVLWIRKNEKRRAV